jgi:predicted nucleotidyltransferase
MNLNNIRIGELKEVFDALEEAFASTQTDYYLIGALARDIWYARGKKTYRGTKDVDFAVLVGSQQDYEAIKEYLKTHKNFTDTKGNSFVMLTPNGMQVDILPFGSIELDGRVGIDGTGLTSIRVTGFQEVYQTGTEPVTTETGNRLNIATLPSIVLLKLIAFDDRPEQRSKDARDIANILQHYFELQSDFIYDHHSDLFVTAPDLSLELIAAQVIGREIKRMAATNEPLYQRLQHILKEHIAQAAESPFIEQMVVETHISADEHVDRLHALLTGMS